VTDESDVSEIGQEIADLDEEADLIRGNTIGEMVEQAVLTGVDMRITAFIGNEQVIVTVISSATDVDADTLH
jgi:hypothetical protein